MIGKIISHYKIIEKIGSGGMGIIYKAQDLKLDRYVALKFLPPELTRDPESKSRFIHEAKAVSALQHSNICTIHEIDETEDEQLFICMDYYEGATLENKIKDKPLSVDQAINITLQILKGLKDAHEKDIIHRDIKPANIMLTDKNEVKILDFGLAKLATKTKLTKDGTTLGTVAYMSPEQANGEEVDHRTDIWSTGVILYEMLTGQLPFRGEFEHAIIYSILNEDPHPINVEIQEQIRQIIFRCLEKDLINRYQNVEELIADLMNLGSDSKSTIDIIPKIRRTFKAVYLPIIILFVLSITGYFLFFGGTDTKNGWENSIAVLPFDDLSPEGDQEWFSVGMTEQIITNLSRIKRLKVIGRTSVMKFKNTEKTLPEIGQELNVSHILEGSIRKYENSIRVTAQLINTEDGSHIWADDFDQELEHVFEVQDDVSQEIASNLLAALSPQEKEAIKTNRPSSIEAYEYYMKGKLYHFNKYADSFDEEDFLASEKMFKAAIKLDPNFADSFASLADLYNLHYNMLADTASEKIKYMQLQEAYLDTAYQLDPNSAEVNNAKAWIYYSKEKYEEAFNSFKIAIKINPNNEQYYISIGNFLFIKGCMHLAIQCCTRAIELNPIGLEQYRVRALSYMYIGEFTKAENNFKKALEINQNKIWVQRNYWMLLLNIKRYEDAKKILVQLKTDYPDEDFTYEQACNYAISGQEEEALSLAIDKLWKSRIYVLAEMKEESIQYLNEDFDRVKNAKGSWYLSMKNLPKYNFIRSDPRFQEILAKHKELYEENMAKYGDLDI